MAKRRTHAELTHPVPSHLQQQVLLYFLQTTKGNAPSRIDGPFYNLTELTLAHLPTVRGNLWHKIYDSEHDEYLYWSRNDIDDTQLEIFYKVLPAPTNELKKVGFDILRGDPMALDLATDILKK